MIWGGGGENGTLPFGRAEGKVHDHIEAPMPWQLLGRRGGNDSGGERG